MSCSGFFFSHGGDLHPACGGGGALRRPSVLRQRRKTLPPGQFTCPAQIQTFGAPAGSWPAGYYSMAIITAALA